MHMIFLVDGDNHLAEGLQGIDLLSADDTVLIFYGKGQPLSRIEKLCQNTQANVQYLESVRSGRNSIDFQIITELGVLVGRGEAEFAYVISQDRGYESAISVLRQRYAATFRDVARRPSIESCLQAAFLLKPTTQTELCQSLEKTFGSQQGMLVYRHLEALFAPVEAEEEKPEKKSRRKKRAAEKEETAKDAPVQKENPRRKKQKKATIPEEEPIVILEGLEDEPEEKPKKRTHRGGRRHHKHTIL